MKRVLARPKLAALCVCALAAAAGVTSFGVFGAHGAEPRTGPLEIRSRLDRPPGSFVRARALYDARGNRKQLAESVSGALMGPLSPVAVASADGSFVAYSTWREQRPVDAERSFSKQGVAEGAALGTPSLRVHDGVGHDFLIARGAYSAAWRDDGALAYVRGVEPDFRAGRAYRGHVVVRRNVHGPDVTWTDEPGRYVVYRWARNRLLFYRLGAGEELELLVAEGPRQVRPLADGSAVALSPDGSRILVLDRDGTTVRALEVASGRERGWLDLTTAAPSQRWVGYSGSWAAEHVVAPASSGLVVFHVGADTIELEQVLGLDHAQFPVGVQQPRFLDDAANEIATTADVPPKSGSGGVSFFLRCDRIARTCERGDAAPATEWLRLVDGGGAR